MHTVRNGTHRVLATLLAAIVVLLAVGVAAAQDDRLVYAIDVDITNLDPIHAIDPGSAAVYQQIHEPLVRIDMNGDIVPVLATSWSASDDSLVWTFELREGVTFHDGTPFDAEAVKHHFDRLLDPNEANRSQGSFHMIESVAAVDTHTVEFTLNEPFAPFLALMANPTATYPSPTAVEEFGDDYAFNPVGTGPWVFEEWASGQYTRLSRNDDYWGEGPGVAELEFRPVVEPGARIVMLETGEADVANSITPDEMERVDALEDVEISLQPVLRGWFIGINNLEEPFDDPRVRRALNHAIDVEVLTDVILSGTATPFTSVVNSRVWGHVEQPDYEYDPTKAQELLAEAGYPDGFEATLWYPASGAGMHPDIPQAIQAMVSMVGIDLVLEPLEMSAFIDNIIKDPEESREAGKELVLLGMGAGTGEASNIMNEFYHTDSWAPSKYNRGFYSNPEVDALLDEALVTGDQDAQLELLAEAQELIWQDAPAVLLYEMMGVYGIRENVEGLQYLPSNYILFNTVSK